MKVNMQPIALSAAITVVIIYTIFAALLAFVPAHLMNFVASMHFMSSMPFHMQFSLMGYVKGVIFHGLITYAIIALWVKVYNYVQR